MRRWPLSQDEPGLDVGAGMIRIGFLGGILAYNCIMGGILAYYNCRIRNPPKLVEVMIIKAPPKKKKCLQPKAPAPETHKPRKPKLPVTFQTLQLAASLQPKQFFRGVFLI